MTAIQGFITLYLLGDFTPYLPKRMHVFWAIGTARQLMLREITGKAQKHPKWIFCLKCIINHKNECYVSFYRLYYCFEMAFRNLKCSTCFFFRYIYSKKYDVKTKCNMVSWNRKRWGPNKVWISINSNVPGLVS